MKITVDQSITELSIVYNDLLIRMERLLAAALRFTPLSSMILAFYL